VSAPEAVSAVSEPPSWGQESRAAVLTAVGVVLFGAPLGLLWAAVTPPVEVVVGEGGSTRLAEPTRDAFIAVDGFFLGLVLLAGLLSGVVAWRFGRRYGPGVVVGLVIGGLLAAEAARLTGELVDVGEAQASVEAGFQGLLALPVRLRAESARAAWPVAALAAHMVLTLMTVPATSRRTGVSSG
jgi:hypothetical protein